FAVEQAMARANLLNSQSFVLLQGLVLFLMCVRRQDDSRYVWTMTSIVLRIAQGIGIHRDGATFGLKPFETEFRRRLWCHVCLLDFQSAEEIPCELSTAFYDTRIPLNINDDDISPGSTETPEERIGCTEMTFCLLRYAVAVTVRRLSY